MSIMGILKSFVSLAPLLLLSEGAGAVSQIDDAGLGSATAFTAQFDRYIVQFSQSGTKKFKRSDGTHDSTEFFSILEKSGKDATPRLTFDSDIFSGVSFDLKAADNQTVTEIEALPEVERIWPAALYSLPVTGAAAVEPSLNYSKWSPHNDTNVARMHEKGYTGEGVVIAFVDSGIDYTHPALGGGFGPGYKVESGYDFVGDDYVLGGALDPDNDPMDCLGHGTHVAGIAASGDDWVTGVAPDARLRSYKVFGCDDGTLEDVIVSAFLRAYEDGADIISASVGSDRGFDATPMALVATSIQERGTFVVFSAGNSGELGPFYTSSGGNGHGSLTVGSVESQDWVGFTVLATSSSGEEREIVYLSAELIEFNINGTVGAYVPANVRELTACSFDIPTPPSGDVLIVPRGTCISQLQDSTLYGKADYVFYVLNGSDWQVPSRDVYSDEQPDGSAAILQEDGEWLISQYENGEAVTLTFALDHKAVAIPRESFAMGRINDFSSWGPTLDGRMKPEISAPGGRILSTWPVASGGWATYSGTSMATPYISGVAALFFAAHGGRSALGTNGAKLAHERIVASGKPIYHNDGTDSFASVAKQGAGLVDAEKVIEYVTYVSPANLNLNDTDHFQGTHEVSITNSGDESVTYQISHEAGITVNVKGTGSAWVSLEPPYSTGDGNVAEVSLSDTELTVGAGQTVTLTIDFAEPSGIDAIYLPVYGGRIILAGDNAEVVSVTYMGIKGSLYNSDIWEMERGVPVLLSGYGGLMEEGHNYTFEDETNVPQPFFNILWSTRELSFDYVTKDWEPSDWVYPPVAGKDNWIGSIRTIPNPLTGSVADFPQYYYPRYMSGMYVQPQGYFSNGTKIPDGEYKILCRVLRTFGDYGNLDDWQHTVSPWFSITRDQDSGSATSAVTPSSTPTDVVTLSSEAPAITSAAPSPTCDPLVRPITLKAQVGDSSDARDFYFYSDFLAIDLDGSKTHPEWNFVNGSALQTTRDNGATVYASVHTNTNSLVYMYTPYDATGSFSFLGCTIDEEDGTVHCESGEKKYFYICDSSDGLIRHGTQVLDGCTALTISAEYDEDDGCPATTIASSGLASATVTATTTPTSDGPVEECSGTAIPVELKAYVGDGSQEYDFYVYSDFLALDLGASQDHLEWEFADGSHLQTVFGGAQVYAAVHTNTNSMIYMYAAPMISGSFSYLECSEADGELRCVSGAKEQFYICDTDQGILRHGTAVLDGCTAVSFRMTRLVSCESGTPSSAASSPTTTLVSTPSVSTPVQTTPSQSVGTDITATGTASETVPESTPPSGSVESSTASETLSESTPIETPSESTPTETPSESAATPTGTAAESASTSAVSSSPSSTETPYESATASSGSGSVSTLLSSSVYSAPGGTLTQSGSSLTAPTSEASTSVSESSIGTAGSATAPGSSSAIQGSTSQSGSVSVSAASSYQTTSQSSATTSGQSQAASVTSSAATEPQGFTTSTVYATTVRTITSCAPTVTDCPSEPRVTTETIAVSTTVCPVTETSEKPSPPSSPSGKAHGSSLTTSTVYQTKLVTVTACPSAVQDCPASAKSTYVKTETIAVETAVQTVTDAMPAVSSIGSNANAVSSLAETQPTGSQGVPSGAAPFEPANSWVRLSVSASTATARVTSVGTVAGDQGSRATETLVDTSVEAVQTGSIVDVEGTTSSPSSPSSSSSSGGSSVETSGAATAQAQPSATEPVSVSGVSRDSHNFFSLMAGVVAVLFVLAM